MRWAFRWYFSADSDFNHDFHTSLNGERQSC
jgi:predicted dithiol-disulfide oxidoreductase (DUF899 family)